MICKNIKILMINALAGDITAEQRRILDQHLNQCRKCSSEYAALTKTLDLANRKKVTEPTEHEWNLFRRDLRRSIRTGAQNQKSATFISRSLKWKKVLVPALALTVIIAGILILTHTPPQQPPAIVSDEIDYYVEKALIAEYLVQQLDLEEIYPSEEASYEDIDQQLEEIEWLL